MKPRTMLLCAAALLALGARPAAAQSTCTESGTRFRIAPTYLNDTHAGGLGLGVGLDACNPRYDTRARFPRATYVNAHVTGVVPFTDLAVPQDIQASLWFGQSISLSERNKDQTEIQLDQVASPYKFHRGFFGYGVHATYEASSDFDEQGVAGGLELRWVDPAKRFLPSTQVILDWVGPLRSAVRDSLAVAKTAYGRLGVRGYWLIPLGTSLQLEADAGYYWAIGLEDALVARGWERGPYGAGTLSWLAGPTVRKRLKLTSAFVGYTQGSRPTAAEERKAWTLGLAFGGG